MSIPVGVTSIEYSAFQNCSALTIIVLPAGITSIANNTFYGCAGLTSVSIPVGVTSIEYSAFQNCSALTEILVPSSVTSIGSSVFANCSVLISLSVDPSNPNFSSVDGVLFNKSQTSLIQYPPGKTGPYPIPASVTSIGSYAFAGCDQLTGVTIPASVTSIGSSAFDNCTVLVSLSVDPSNPNFSSVDGVLFNKSQTAILVYPAGKAGPYMIPASVTSVTISNGFNVRSAFSYCTGLTSLSVDPSNPNFSSVNGVLFNKSQTILVKYPPGKTGSYSIPSGVTSFEGDAFSDCSGLTRVTIPASVTSIGTLAFSNCASLVSAEFLGSVASLGYTRMFPLVSNPASGFTIYYHKGKSDFTSPTWEGFPSIALETAPLSILTAALPTGKIGDAYSQRFAATGGSTPYSWSLVSGSLPAGLSLASDGALTGTPTAGGTVNFVIQVSGSDGLFSADSFTLTLAPPFATWQASRFTAVDVASGHTAMTDDFDGDGTPNLLEYAFGGDPKTPDAAAIAPVPDSSGSDLDISFLCDSACTDLTYTVQASSNLASGSWTDIAQSTGGARVLPIGTLSTVSDPGTGLRTVTVTDSSTLSSGRFLRVKITTRQAENQFP